MSWLTPPPSLRIVISLLENPQVCLSFPALTELPIFLHFFWWSIPFGSTKTQPQIFQILINNNPLAQERSGLREGKLLLLLLYLYLHPTASSIPAWYTSNTPFISKLGHHHSNLAKKWLHGSVASGMMLQTVEMIIWGFFFSIWIVEPTYLFSV